MKNFNPRIKARIRKNKQIISRNIEDLFGWIKGAELVSLKKFSKELFLDKKKSILNVSSNILLSRNKSPSERLQLSEGILKTGKRILSDVLYVITIISLYKI